MKTAKKWRPRLLFACMLVTGTIAGTLTATCTYASVSGCRTDPIVVLSNGMQVELDNTIADVSANVSKVVYTLHGPVGTTVQSVSYVNTTSGIDETFQYVADNGAGNYDSYSAMYDSTPGVNANYYMTLTNLATTATMTQMAQTHLSSSGSILHIHLHMP